MPTPRAATVYLLTALTPPTYQRERAARLLGRDRPAGPVPLHRTLLWAPLGAASFLLAFLVVGNAVQALIAMPLWPLWDPVGRPRLFIDVPITSWAVALTLGPLQVALMAAVTVFVFPPLAALHARASLALLTPPAAQRLAARVGELTRTRADVLDAHGAELRRIERDLHDGTQARLVAIAMRLDLARQSTDPAFTDRLLREAHTGAEEAMAELRDVIRGVYPPILADRGLDGALSALAARCPVPARLDADDVGRVPAAVEVVVYFTVAEALTNVARHSGATTARVHLTRDHDALVATVTDDGHGGADPALGTGLTGISGRVSALDGTLSVDSPPGGPTTLTVRVPCG